MIIIGISWLGMCPALLAVQDVLVLRTQDGKTTRRGGVITDWKGDQVSLKARTRTRTIDADRIVEIETNWPVPMQRGRDLMQAGKFTEAIAAFAQARENDKRAWVGHIITAEKLQCHDALDQKEKALVEFLKLYQQDPQTRYFYLVPIPWMLDNRYPAAGRFGSKLLNSKNSLLGLISSSLLLNGPEKEQATVRLNQLTTDRDMRIAQLATTQLWRSELLSANENTVQRWQRQVDKLPDKFKAGPLVLLAQAQSRAGDQDQAVINFMKLPILYPAKKSLCALALYRSGEILENKGKTKLAKQLHQELFRDFASSQYAERARQK